MKPLPAALCLTFLLGCSRTPPYQQQVEADTPLNFAMWRSKHSDALTSKEWSLFNQAVDELKLKILMNGQASGGEAVDEALRAKIDGVKLCDVLREGLKIRRDRLSAEKTILEESLTYNSQIKLKPGKEGMAPLLAEKIADQSVRLKKLKETVAEAEADLQALELKFK